MITVACVCVPGPAGYTMDHVNRLYNQVSSRMPERDWIFHVITESDKPGWWAKIDLFRPGAFSGRVLYFDLDVDVIEDIEPIIHYPAPFVAINDWNLQGINSSVMAWDAGACDHIHERFSPEMMGRFRGDQDYIHSRIKCATFPFGWCVSYKKHVMPTGHVPNGAKVVVYHGKPRPWEVEIK